MKDYDEIADSLIQFSGVLADQSKNRNGAASIMIEAAAIVRSYERLEKQFERMAQVAERAIWAAEK